MNISYITVPIEDSKILEYLNNITNIWYKNSVKEFKQLYHNWIIASKNSSVLGLDTFDSSLTDGVTGAFYNFNHAFNNFNTVIFKGEYPLHTSTGADMINSVEDLEYGQKLIISYPFAAHGEIHHNFEDILSKCDLLNIPVLIDMAFFGCAKLPLVNVDRPCIKMVAFSLSKTFSTGKCKIGVCYHKNIQNTPMQVINSYEYVNHVSINIHTILLSKFDSDYIYNKYKDKQQLIANTLNVTASSTVFLCHTNDIKWKKFSRNNLVNRLGIARLLQVENLTSTDILNAELIENPYIN
jgi:hypothetical protein